MTPTALLLSTRLSAARTSSIADDFNEWAALAEYPMSEYFQPDYTAAQNAPRPEYEIVASSSPSADPVLAWDGWLRVEVENEVPVARATLIKLGSTTHGFDQDQRFIELSIGEERHNMYTIYAPVTPPEPSSKQPQHTAPPGYYMLFLVSTVGQPSMGQYVRIGAGGPGSGGAPIVGGPIEVGQ